MKNVKLWGMLAIVFVMFATGCYGATRTFDDYIGSLAAAGTLSTSADKFPVLQSGVMKYITFDSMLATAGSTTTTELGYVHGVTSNIQTQLNGKALATSGNLFTPNIFQASLMNNSSVIVDVVSNNNTFVIWSTDAAIVTSFNRDIVAFNTPTVTFTKISVSNATAPTHNTSTGTTGEIRFDTNYMYRCTATNTWKRVLLDATAW